MQRIQATINSCPIFRVVVSIKTWSTRIFCATGSRASAAQSSHHTWKGVLISTGYREQRFHRRHFETKRAPVYLPRLPRYDEQRVHTGGFFATLEVRKLVFCRVQVCSLGHEISHRTYGNVGYRYESPIENTAITGTGMTFKDSENLSGTSSSLYRNPHLQPGIATSVYPYPE